MKKGFSGAQHYKWYRPAVKRAWLAECKKTGTSPNDKAAYDDWYRSELLSSPLHVKSTKECNATTDFETLMLHFAILLDDEKLISRFSDGSERRLKHVISEAMKDLEWLLKEPITWNYIRGIWTQSKMLPKSMDEAPAWHLYKVNQMIDEHIQRICGEFGIRRREVPDLRQRGASVEKNITTIKLPGSDQQLLPF